MTKCKEDIHLYQITRHVSKIFLTIFAKLICCWFTSQKECYGEKWVIYRFSIKGWHIVVGHIVAGRRRIQKQANELASFNQQDLYQRTYKRKLDYNGNRNFTTGLPMPLWDHWRIKSKSMNLLIKEDIKELNCWRGIFLFKM